MRFRNYTTWQDNDLRAIVQACSKVTKVGLNKVQVIVKPFRGRGETYSFSSKARRLSIRLTRPGRTPQGAVDALALTDEGLPIDTKKGSALAGVITAVHQGLLALDFGHAYPLLVSKFTPLPDWAASLVLRPKEVEKKVLTPEERLNRRLLKAGDKLANADRRAGYWRRKLKLAETKVKHYEREVKRLKKVQEKIEAARVAGAP